MSGHSKWHSIKHAKGAADAARGKQFARLARQIEVAARSGGGDIEGNPTLRTMIQKARDASMPKDNIERAIKRGTGELNDGARYEELAYEGYAPGGVALLIEVLTDNRNRTGQEIRHAFTRNGGNLGEQGSTAWMFARKGLIEIEKAAAPDEDRLLELALEAGAEDLRDAESSWEILTEPQALRGVREALEAAGIAVPSAELTMMPNTAIPVDGGEAKQVLNLIESLEDLDDVQAVYANFDISEELMSAL
jgi:YebC/PmpR family DNA-binding regulatory protein